MNFETWMLVLFAGGPGLVALTLQSIRWWGERPLRNATAAQVLTTTATGLLDHMQEKIDTLEAELHAAQQEISELRGRLEEATQHSRLMGQLQERLRATEQENDRLRALTAQREEMTNED